MHNLVEKESIICENAECTSTVNKTGDLPLVQGVQQEPGPHRREGSLLDSRAAQLNAYSTTENEG
jgi:hypothetical protein